MTFRRGEGKTCKVREPDRREAEGKVRERGSVKGEIRARIWRAVSQPRQYNATLFSRGNTPYLIVLPSRDGESFEFREDLRCRVTFL